MNRYNFILGSMRQGWILCLTFLVGAPLVSSALAIPQSEQDQAFTQAVADFNQGRFTSARAKLAQVQGVHAQEAKQYIEKINTYEEKIRTARMLMSRDQNELDPSTIDSAIQDFNDAIKICPNGPGNPAAQLKKAQDLKAQMAKASTPSSPPPEKPASQKVQPTQQPTADGGDNSGAFAEAKAEYEANNFRDARTMFEALSGSSAQAYVEKIAKFDDLMNQARQLSRQSKYEEARLAYAAAANIKSNGPGDPWPKAFQMELLEGLDQFYSGDYKGAIQHLGDYAANSGQKQALPRFYLGASELGLFYLTGKADQKLQQDALNDLRAAKQAGFKPEMQDISPSILQVYQELAL